MTSIRKRVVRQRMWPGDKADARAVGENLRNIDSSVTSQPAILKKSLDNIVYPEDGLTFALATPPWAVLNVFSQNVDGTWQGSAVAGDWVWRNGGVIVKFDGLTVGARYATIRLLVVG